MAFAFENWGVYRQSLAWVEAALPLVDSLAGPCPEDIKDRMARAAVSVPVHIAQAFGRVTRLEKSQALAAARDAVHESASLIHVLARLGFLREREASHYGQALADLAQGLGGLGHAFETRDARPALLPVGELTMSHRRETQDATRGWLHGLM